MTSNQINYQNHLEGVRHNMAMEAETKRANLAGEAIGRANASANQTGAYASVWQAQNTQYYNQEYAKQNRRTSGLQLWKGLLDTAKFVLPLILTRNVSAARTSTNRYLM